MILNEGAKLQRAVLCTPLHEYGAVDDLSRHNFAASVNSDLAVSQHKGLQKLLVDLDCEVIDIAELAGHPNSVFTMDPAVAVRDGYIKLRMGLESRRGEEDWLAGAVDALAEPCVGVIDAPGTAEGGDIIAGGKVVFVGLSSRSNKAGIEQLKDILGAMGYEVRVAPVPAPFLHIGGAMTLVGPATVFCCKGVFPPGFFDGFKVIEVPENEFVSGNVINAGLGNVIVEERNKSGAEALSVHGFEVHTVDLGEFLKGTGGPSCLIMPLERS